MDEVERQYELAIANAVNHGDNDAALYLLRGLKEYRDDYKEEE